MSTKVVTKLKGVEVWQFWTQVEAKRNEDHWIQIVLRTWPGWQISRCVCVCRYNSYTSTCVSTWVSMSQQRLYRYVWCVLDEPMHILCIYFCCGHMCGCLFGAHMCLFASVCMHLMICFVEFLCVCHNVSRTACYTALVCPLPHPSPPKKTFQDQPRMIPSQSPYLKCPVERFFKSSKESCI